MWQRNMVIDCKDTVVSSYILQMGVHLCEIFEILGQFFGFSDAKF